MATDLSSHSNPDEAVVTHLSWNATVDFDRRIITAEATYDVAVVVQSENVDADPKTTTLRLDTSGLEIESVVLRRHPTDEGTTTTTTTTTPLEYELDDLDETRPHLGRRLSIALPPGDGDNVRVTVAYRTTDACTAAQWLPPAQTSGGRRPYLFTQCQAIHARSLVPCQDRCGVKATYDATVDVPAWATCVLSALSEGETTDGTRRVCRWRQPVPVSSYLLALAVGDLARVVVSDRCAVWSEPGLVAAAADEFAETETFLRIAEEIAGTPYAWGRYDLLCLPPSFPFGGMENPCLTFVTPTLLAGDRSLADVVAHEIAHSWTGNLVTNATWDHFWLNEGWTTWFQRKIMARIKNDPAFLDFDAIDGRKHLRDALEEMTPKNTRLVLDIGDGDPDDSYSSVAYEKGFTFLLYLERLVGTDAFEAFFRAYVARFASRTLTSEDFRSFFLEHFESDAATIHDEVDWETWFHGEGHPPVYPELDTSLASASQRLADLWLAVDREGATPPRTNETSSWSSLQITCFLDDLAVKIGDAPLRPTTLSAMNALYEFAESRNSEVLFRYCSLAVPAEDASVLPVVVRFITTQGRMKFVRPLYRALVKSDVGRDLAVATFAEHADAYHPICAKMVASDLRAAREHERRKEDEEKAPSSSSSYSSSDDDVAEKRLLAGALIAAGVAATTAFVLLRRR